MDASTLTLHLHSHDASLPEGNTLAAIDPLRAVITSLQGGPEVHLALPNLSRAELRWAIDQVRRKVSALLKPSAAELVLAPSIDEDTALTVALDLHQATEGQVGVRGREELTQRMRTLGELEDGYRAWVNEDPNTRTSLAIAEDIRAWGAKQEHVEVEVLAEERLRELGLNLLLAVGRGSELSPSRLVIARYTPAGAEQRAPLMLLGKGITFDTGGINVKPYEAFVSMMKNDMGGAALAWSLFRGLVEHGAPRPLVLVIPTCENAVGHRSMHPGDVVKSYRGLTVRIDHTDAEGRLVLADGLAYASDTYAPEEIWCFATLTTAALIAYGPFATPVHFASPQRQQELAAAAEAMGEDLHFFPSRLWHREANCDQEADLRNTARLPSHANKGAGSRNAAHFLAHFTDRPLVHFDIFASTWNWSGEAPGCGYGATGAPLRTLWRALRRGER